MLRRGSRTTTLLSPDVDRWSEELPETLRAQVRQTVTQGGEWLQVVFDHPGCTLVPEDVETLITTSSAALKEVGGTPLMIGSLSDLKWVFTDDHSSAHLQYEVVSEIVAEHNPGNWIVLGSDGYVCDGEWGGIPPSNEQLLIMAPFLFLSFFLVSLLHQHLVKAPGNFEHHLTHGLLVAATGMALYVAGLVALAALALILGGTAIWFRKRLRRA